MEINLKVDAVQWFKDGDHPDVTLAGPRIYRRGQGAYIEGLWPFATCWVEYERLSEKPEEPKGGIFDPMVAVFDDPVLGRYYRRVWPFNMWSLKGPKEHFDIESEEQQRFYADCLAVERSFDSPFKVNKEPPVPHGWLNPPATDGRIAVYPGDWIVRLGETRLIMSDKDFKSRYSSAAE